MGRNEIEPRQGGRVRWNIGDVLVGYHLLAEGVDRGRAEAAWASWLTRAFGGDRNGSG